MIHRSLPRRVMKRCRTKLSSNSLPKVPAFLGVEDHPRLRAKKAWIPRRRYMRVGGLCAQTAYR